jgi:hypothetical protein
VVKITECGWLRPLLIFIDEPGLKRANEGDVVLDDPHSLIQQLLIAENDVAVNNDLAKKYHVVPLCPNKCLERVLDRKVGGEGAIDPLSRFKDGVEFGTINGLKEGVNLPLRNVVRDEVEDVSGVCGISVLHGIR